MAASQRQKRKSERRGKKTSKEKASAPAVSTIRPSLLGWIVPLGPLLVILFLLLFGRSLPFLMEQASVEAEDAAAVVCQGAEAEIKEGDYQGAYNRLMYALQIKPDYADAYIKLGKLYYLNQDISSAIACLRKAVSLEPPQKDLVLNNLGLLYGGKGDYQTALSLFEQALSSGLNAEQIYNNIGNAHLSLGDYDQAVQAFQAAIAARTTLRSLYIEMLRKTIIDFGDSLEFSEVCQAAKDQLERGVTDEELSRYDSEIASRFARSERRQAELNRNLARAMELKQKGAER